LQCKSSFEYPPGFPPGPRFPLPLLGEVWVLGFRDFTASIASMASKYNGAFGFYVNKSRIVVLSSPELIKEAMSREELTDRPFLPSIALSRKSTR